jgi:hypothetical protein
VLGDKVSFKSTLSSKLKKELYTVAEDEKWGKLNEHKILSRMHAHQFAPPFKICI